MPGWPNRVGRFVKLKQGWGKLRGRFKLSTPSPRKRILFWLWFASSWTSSMSKSHLILWGRETENELRRGLGLVLSHKHAPSWWPGLRNADVGLNFCSALKVPRDVRFFCLFFYHHVFEFLHFWCKKNTFHREKQWGKENRFLESGNWIDKWVQYSQSCGSSFGPHS